MAESGIAVGPRRGGNAHEIRRAPGGEAPASSGAVAAAQLRSDVGVWERRYACRRMITWCAHPPPPPPHPVHADGIAPLPFPARHTRAPVVVPRRALCLTSVMSGQQGCFLREGARVGLDRSGASKQRLTLSPRLVGLSLSPAQHVEWSTTAVVSLSHTCQLLVHSSYTATVCRLSLVCTSTQPSSFIGDSKDVPCGPPKQMLARCTLEPRHTAPIAMSDIDDPHTPELRTATMS
ncbi:hypothetical protein L1887_50275 [Cichorium endivia]|nr:hypothetical protein L1887_50275 [Cichorium endivia]